MKLGQYYITTQHSSPKWVGLFTFNLFRSLVRANKRQSHHSEGFQRARRWREKDSCRRSIIPASQRGHIRKRRNERGPKKERERKDSMEGGPTTPQVPHVGIPTAGSVNLWLLSFRRVWLINASSPILGNYLLLNVVEPERKNFWC